MDSYGLALPASPGAMVSYSVPRLLCMPHFVLFLLLLPGMMSS
jgi:hypothetical protein